MEDDWGIVEVNVDARGEDFRGVANTGKAYVKLRMEQVNFQFWVDAKSEIFDFRGLMECQIFDGIFDIWWNIGYVMV